MKYLKKSAEVLIGKAGGQNEQKLSKYGLTEHTAMLTLVTHYSDGSGEELLGICVTREHLEQIRNAINDYLPRTDTPASEKVGSVNNFNIKAETGLTEAQVLGVFGQVSQQVKQMLQNSNQQKQTQLVIDPRLMMVNQIKPTGTPNSWFAKIHILAGHLKDFNTDGRLELSTLGSSEENAKERLNIEFHNFIMGCINPDSSESKTPNIVKENQQLVNLAEDKKIKLLNFDLSKATSKKINEGWEARIVYWNGCNIEVTAFGNTETEAKNQLYKELLVRLSDQLSADLFSDANEPENSKQVNKTDDKDATQFKLDLSRVMSMKIGVDKWEARTRVFKGISDGLVDLVATADSEEAAREKLDDKFSDFARGMTNFIKFMSQAS